MTPFQSPERFAKEFSSEAAGRLIAAANDISLIVDSDGVIRDVAFGGDDQPIAGAEDWVGQRWRDTVTDDSRAKIDAMMETGADERATRWRQVNHPAEGAPDVPVLYKAVRVGDRDTVVAVGRDLRPVSRLQQQLLDVQHSMERDYARLHQAETRYRMLFTMATEGIVIVDADGLRVVEANPAAGRLLGRNPGQLARRRFTRGFSEPSEEAIEKLFDQVRAAGSGDDIAVQTASDDRQLILSATLLRREDGTFFLVRLSPESRPADDATSHVMLEIINRSPDGFVVTDPDGRILRANNAFVELCQLGSELQMRQQPLERWLGRPGVDVDLLRKNLRQRELVRQFGTTLNPEFGESFDVELSAVSALDSDQPCLGFVIRRSIRRAPQLAEDPSQPLARSLEGMAELVGQRPLRDLVRQTTEIIERLCIEAALRATDDNRASAAEMLGLSRQSLYVKLRRYGLGDNGRKES